MTVSLLSPSTGLVPWHGDQSLARRFRDVAAALPSQTAIETAGGILTYRELDRRSDGWSSCLLAASPNGVAILLHDLTDFVTAILAVLKAGTHYVPIDTGYPPDRIAHLLHDSGCLTVISDGDSIKLIPAGSLKQLQIIKLSTLPADGPALPDPPGGDAPASILYTSGSTGKPKGVILTGGVTLRKTEDSVKSLGVSSGDRCSSFSSPAFARGASEIFTALLAGATLLPLDTREIGLLALGRWIQEKEPTIIRLLAAQFRRLASVTEGSMRFPSLRLVRLGGETITRADVALFRRAFEPHTALLTTMASTEASGIAFNLIRSSDPLPPQNLPLGRLQEGVEVTLVDSEGRTVRDGDPGEMVVSSPYLSAGYWRSPELTDASFRTGPDGVRRFHSGDLAVRRNGELYFAGRADQLLKIRGTRVDPLEVENLLMANPRLREVAVVGQERSGQTSLTCYWVGSEGVEISAREMRAAVAARLPAQMVPSRFVQLDALPLAPNGKVDRRQLALRTEETPQPTEDGQGSGRRDRFVERVCRIAAMVLNLPSVGPDDHFFDDSGGDSLTAAHYFAELERETDVQLPLSVLLDAPTPRMLADRLRGGEGTEFRILVPLRSTGSRPPLFVVHAGGGNLIGFYRFSVGLGEDQPVYSLQASGLSGTLNVPTTFEEMARLNLEEIRRVQPSGPYRILGYSLGGRLAWEMASQLRDDGEEIAFLGLLDALAHPGRANLSSRLLNRLGQLRRNPGQHFPGYVREYFLRGRRWLLRRTMDGRPLRRDDLASVLRRVAITISEAYRAYHLTPAPHRVVLFRAENGFRRIVREEDLGWSEFARGGVEIRDVPGEHFTMLGRPFVAAVAAEVRKALLAADAPSDKAAERLPHPAET